MSIQQDSLDYSNEAQYRVCADTRALVKKATLQVVEGQQTYTLADDVIQIQSLVGATPLRVDEGLEVLTGNLSTCDLAYFVLGRTLTFVSEPSESQSLTMFYTARPNPLTSDAEFEVQRDFELVIDRLVQAMRLSDDGQPELGAEEQSWYDQESAKLRGRTGREQRSRVLVAGFDTARGRRYSNDRSRA